MCGIAGILTTDPTLDLHDPLSKLRSALTHRGPDGSGSQLIRLPSGARIGLVHTRLAILDLTAAGHQPMHEPASGSWIVYNGEIYNHEAIRRSLQSDTFFSRTDTETILSGWVERGSPVLGQLRGMFAFALYDARRQQFWLVRDRLGIKPLYVSQSDDRTWIFASEVRAILATGLVPRRLSQEAVESYLAFGSVIAPQTLVQGIQSLMPAEAWSFNLRAGELEPQRNRYWRLPFVEAAPAKFNREQVVGRIREVLCESTRMRMLADVPVGVFLSGGIDSSGIVSTIAGSGQPLHTFSVSFDEHEFDESQYAATVAQHFETKHQDLRLRAADVLQNFEQVLAAYDQPSLDGLNSYFISAEVRRAGVKVALSGLGGDELFAGYPMFRRVSMLDRKLVRQLLLLLSSIRSTRSRSRAAKLKEIVCAGCSRIDRFAAYRHVIRFADRHALTRGNLLNRAHAIPARQFDDIQQADRLDPINAHSLLELSLYLGNVLLRDADQMSMAHSLEVRVPLIDHVLVELLAKTPGPLKLHGSSWGTAKALLRDALPRPLPNSVVRRRKMGFSFPWDRWLRGELQSKVAEVFHDASGCQRIGLAPQAVRSMWLDFVAGRPTVRSTDILTILNLASWCRHHGLSLDCGIPLSRAA